MVSSGHGHIRAGSRDGPHALADPSLEPAAHGFADAEDYLVPVRAVFPAPDVAGGQLYLVARSTGRLHRADYLDDLPRYDVMTPTGGQTFEAFGLAGSISWHERAPHLVGEAALVAAVEATLRASGPTIAVTPTGPFSPATPSNAEAVFAALLHLGRFEFSGDVPSFTVPVGADA